MAYPTADDFWRDDPNKTFFELQTTEPKKPLNQIEKKTA